MSVSSHNAPIRRLENSNSNRSLYTENSNDSDRVKSPKNQHLHNHDQPVSNQINKLPAIGKEAVRTPEKAQNKNNDEIPSVPQFRTVEVSPEQRKPPSGTGFRFGSNQMNTIGVMNEGSRMRTPYEYEPHHPYRITGMSAISGIQHHENERSRMLRSSQGGRWFRSQSLMQEKEKKSSDYLIKNYHRNGSKYTEQLEAFLKNFAVVEKMLTAKHSNHKISLYDSLEEVKNKMETYLQSKIDLSNLPIDRPDADWGQGQLMNFYQNYHQILAKKLQLPEDVNEDPRHSQTVLKKYKNCAYFGPIKDGKKNGFGYLHYFSGRFFEGLFRMDQKVEGFQMDDSELQSRVIEYHNESSLTSMDHFFSDFLGSVLPAKLFVSYFLLVNFISLSSYPQSWKSRCPTEQD